MQIVLMIIDAIRLPSFACFGAVILYVLNKLQGKQPFSFFVALNIDVSNQASWHMVLLDMLLSSLIGGIAVFFITSPATEAQAIMVGLGMTGVLFVIPASGGNNNGK
ncbi:MAG TPA: hypothetical protein VLS45_09670 [Methylomicrobium sp.]|nr:hypothetical protein [Methylomicrobium sp.]